jgi:hypothetical protein
MIDEDTDRRLTQMLEDLGPADPPAGFVRQVMERISLEDRHQIRGRIVPFHKGGVAMTRKAMWGLAAAAAVVLSVYVIKGFPPVDRGTEGTIGAAQKYQAPQIGDKDVVLGDAAAQEFLQSEAFDRLLKDPQARSLLADKSVQAELKKVDFIDAIRNDMVRNALSSELLRNVLNDKVAQAELSAEINANLSAKAVNQVARTAHSAEAHSAAMTALMSNTAVWQGLSNKAVSTALANDGFRTSLARNNLAGAFNNAAFVATLHSTGMLAALANGQLAVALSTR